MQPVRLDQLHPEEPVRVVRQQGRLDQPHPEEPVPVVHLQGRGLGEDLEEVDLGSLYWSQPPTD